MHNTNACKAGGALSAHPEMAEGLSCITSQAPEDHQTERNSCDSAAEAASMQSHSKVFATLAARAALLRCVLRNTEDGYLVTRTGWGLSRSLPTLADVESLLKLMEGTR